MHTFFNNEKLFSSIAINASDNELRSKFLSNDEIADKFSKVKWVASDLLAQAEHDINSQCILISKDKNILRKAKSSILEQLKDLPRKDFSKKPFGKDDYSLQFKEENSDIFY